MLFLKVHLESSCLMELLYRREAKDQLNISLEPQVLLPPMARSSSSHPVLLLLLLALPEWSSPMVKTFSLDPKDQLNISLVHLALS